MDEAAINCGSTSDYYENGLTYLHMEQWLKSILLQGFIVIYLALKALETLLVWELNITDFIDLRSTRKASLDRFRDKFF